MRRRDFLKASAPALALPALCATDSIAEPYPTELTIERVKESDLWLRGVREGDLVVVHREPGYRADSTYLDPNGVAVRAQHTVINGIRVFIDPELTDDGSHNIDVIAEGLSKDEFAAAGYRYIEAVFYQLESGRWMQGSMHRFDDEVVIVEHMDAETFYASSQI